MLILVILLLVLALIAAVFGFLSHNGSEQPVDPAPTCATCSGEDSRCEQECMMEAATKDIEYFEDEELDRFRGRAADSYTDHEIEEFAEVMYTLRQNEVAAWNRSLILRGINIPNQLKDEILLLISE